MRTRLCIKHDSNVRGKLNITGMQLVYKTDFNKRVLLTVDQVGYKSITLPELFQYLLAVDVGTALSSQHQ